MYWSESSFPDRALSQVDVDHPDLDGDGIRWLRQQGPPYDAATRRARQLLFHWQAWRWIMEGRLCTGDAGPLAAED